MSQYTIFRPEVTLWTWKYKISLATIHFGNQEINYYQIQDHVWGKTLQMIS